MFIYKHTQISIDSADMCIYKQNGFMMKAESYKVILHINR